MITKKMFFLNKFLKWNLFLKVILNELINYQHN